MKLLNQNPVGVQPSRLAQLGTDKDDVLLGRTGRALCCLDVRSMPTQACISACVCMPAWVDGWAGGWVRGGWGRCVGLSWLGGVGGWVAGWAACERAQQDDMK